MLEFIKSIKRNCVQLEDLPFGMSLTPDEMQNAIEAELNIDDLRIPPEKMYCELERKSK